LWYWKDLGVKIPDGTEVKVRGSKSLGKNGKLYVIGQEMEVISAGKVYAFRDDNGYPLWKGGRSGARGIGGGFGSTQHRFGGGMNSMGKGRR
jgi:outer membrane protein assembly factor BamB